jgi:RHS repeat-associated protein
MVDLVRSCAVNPKDRSTKSTLRLVMRRLFLLSAIALSSLLGLSSAEARTTLSLSVTPKPVRACSTFSVGWSGTFDAQSSVSLAMTNQKTGATVYWTAADVAQPGTDGASYLVRAVKSWPSTNTMLGATYKIRASVNGVEVAQESLPILKPTSNQIPTANSIEVSTPENMVYQGVLPGSDADGDNLTFTVVAQPANGTVAVDPASGAFVFTPEPNWTGSTSFSYSVEDCFGAAVGTVGVTVYAINQAPVAENVMGSGSEDSVLGGFLLASDGDGDPLSFQLVSQPANGVLTLDSSTGAFAFSPEPNWFGTTSFTFVAFDGIKYSAPATVTLVFLPVNDAPVASDGQVVGQEEGVLTGVAQAFDIDGPTITYGLVSSPISGAFQLDPATGAFEYKPAADWNGETSFTFRASDGSLHSNVATVRLTVQPVNDAPVLQPLALSTNEDTAVNGQLVAVDVDHDTLTFEQVSGTDKGQLTLDTSSGAVRFTPNADWNGTTAVVVRVGDGTAFSNEEAITIVVTPVNDAPIAANITDSTDEDVAFSGSVSASDIDGNALTYRVVTEPQYGSVTLDGASGNFTFSPSANWNGETSFTFVANDGIVDSAPATARIEVAAVNDAPVVDPLLVTGLEDTAIVGSATAFDVENDLLLFFLSGQPNHGAVSVLPDGSFSYVPQPDWNGSDEFFVEAFDGYSISSPQKITVSVVPVDDAPVAPDVSYLLAEDTALAEFLPVNDIDGDSVVLQVVNVSGPVASVVLRSNPPTLELTPAANLSGQVAVVYSAITPGATSTGTIIVNVLPVNDPPVAEDSSATGEFGKVVQGSLRATDIDSENLVYSVPSLPQNGVLELNAHGSYSFAPTEGWFGTETIAFTVSDGELTDTGTLTITVNEPVPDTNTPPVAGTVTFHSYSGATITRLLPGSDSDNDPLTYRLVGSAQGGVVSLTGGAFTFVVAPNFSGLASFTYAVSDGLAEQQGVVNIDVMNVPIHSQVAATKYFELNYNNPSTEIHLDDSDPDGNPLIFSQPQPVAAPTAMFSPVPVQGFWNVMALSRTATQANYSYVARDGNTVVVNGTITLKYTGAPRFLPPTAGDFLAKGTAGNEIAGIPAASDPNGGNYSVAVVDAPTRGYLSRFNSKSFVYVPSTSEPGIDSFTYTASDGIFTSAKATVTVVSLPVNHTPVASAGNFSLVGDGDVTGVLSAFDYDRDPLAYSVVRQPDSGTLTINRMTGEFRFVPTPSFLGTISFDFAVSDGTSTSAAATVTINVYRAPSATGLAFSALQSKPINGTLLGVGYNGAPLTYQIVQPPSVGTISLNPSSGAFSFSAEPTWFGDAQFTYRVMDQFSSSAPATVTLHLEPIGPPVAYGDSIVLEQGEVHHGILSGLDPQGFALSYSILEPSPDLTATVHTDGSYSVYSNAGFFGVSRFTVVANNGFHYSPPATVEVEVREVVGGNNPPPDPSLIAPPVDDAVNTNQLDSYEFLYRGSPRVQFGVTSEAISPVRFAILRGRVLRNDTTPLPGVRISIDGHPEYGYTLSRDDGRYDLVVNGGETYVVSYDAPGFLVVRREAKTVWRDFTVIEGVILTRRQEQATLVELGGGLQVARGDIESDVDGERRATVLFPSGTAAQLVLRDGTQVPVSRLNIRVTEFTVGAGGREAMPFPLPSRSGYTYAVDLSSDEAIAAGAVSVTYSQPVAVFVENFVGFPVGTTVPVGYFDENRGAWAAEPNGLVIKVLSVNLGIATISVDASGAAATSQQLVSLGVTREELESLGTLYAAGQTLWRVQIRHQCAWDFNWGIFPPWDIRIPPMPDIDLIDNPFGEGDGDHSGEDNNEPTTCQGCRIEVENQAVIQDIPVKGTPYTLVHKSSRAPLGTYYIRIPLTDGTIPASLKRIELDAHVQGRDFHYEVAPSADAVVVVAWDGRDAFGRFTNGKQLLRYTITYVYPLTYGATPGFDYTPNDEHFFGDASRELAEYYLKKSGSFSVGTWSPPDSRKGLGRWDLNVHHTYDVNDRTLRLGDGTDVFSQGLGRLSGEEIIDWSFCDIRKIVPVPDGSIVGLRSCWGWESIVSSSNRWYAQLRHDGYPYDEHTLESPNGSALLPQITTLKTFAFDRDQNLYVGTTDGEIYRLNGDGVVRITGAAGDYFVANGAPVSNGVFVHRASGIEIIDMIFDADNELIVATSKPSMSPGLASGHLWRVDAAGTVHSILGSASGVTVEGLGTVGMNPRALALNADGRIAITDWSGGRIYEYWPNKTVTWLAGSGHVGFSGDGGPARQADIVPAGITYDSQGNLFVAASDHGVRVIDRDGIINTYACVQAIRTACDYAVGVAVTEEGSLIHATQETTLWGSNGALNEVKLAYPSLGIGNIIIQGRDGKEIYVFDSTGRHLKTIDATTQVVLYEMLYDSKSRFIGVRDQNGNETRIIRDGSGAPSYIENAYGQKTRLWVDGENRLVGVSDELLNTYWISYIENDPRGALIQSFKDPNGHTTNFEYDKREKLLQETQPNGGVQRLAKSHPDSRVYEVRFTDARARTTIYSVVGAAANNMFEKVTTYPDGTQVTGIRSQKMVENWSFPNGVTTTTTFRPDVRFGQDTMWPTHNSTMPSGLTRTVANARGVDRSSSDYLSADTVRDYRIINGRPYVSTYKASTRTRTIQKPMSSRVSTVEYDTRGRVVTTSTGGIVPTELSYDARGQVSRIAQAQRTVDIVRDSLGRATSWTDALNRTTNVEYDSANRVISSTLPEGRRIDFSYDRNGNLTSVTPPGRTPHTFTFSPVDLVTGYDAPNADDGAGITTYDYNLAKQLVAVNRPDGVTVNYFYEGDAALGTVNNPNTGRLKVIRQPRGDTTWTYDSAGRVGSVTSPDGGKVSYTYDGSLVTGFSWANSVVNGSVSRTYNTRTFVDNGVTKTGSDFWVASESVNGSTVNFGYDLDGLLTSAGSMTVSRDPQNGLITGSTLGNSTESVSFNGFAEPVLYLAKVSGLAKYEVSYQRDQIGRLESKTETIDGTTTTYSYSYSLGGQLTGVNVNGAPYSTYILDANGNRLSYSGWIGSYSGVYDEQDRLVSYGDFDYTHDKNGNHIQKKNRVTGEMWSFAFDALDNLMSVTLPDGKKIDYVYDGYSRRIAKKVNGALERGWLYADKYRVVGEVDSSGTLVSRFVYGTRHHVPSYMIRGGVTYRLVPDHLGSIRLVINTATGDVVQRIDYDEFGNITLDTNPGFQPFGYAGGILDQATGLTKFGVRDYDPFTGRWLTKEPLRFKGAWNFYTYANGDPINHFDYTGMKPGDTFSSPDCAAKDAVNWARSQPDAGMAEHGGWIIQNPDGTWTYDDSWTSGWDGDQPATNWSGNADVPPGGESSWHSHIIDRPGDEVPSETDEELSEKLKRITGGKVYTGGSDGSLWETDNGRTTYIPPHLPCPR